MLKRENLDPQHPTGDSTPIRSLTPEKKRVSFDDRIRIYTILATTSTRSYAIPVQRKLALIEALPVARDLELPPEIDEDFRTKMLQDDVIVGLRATKE